MKERVGEEGEDAGWLGMMMMTRSSGGSGDDLIAGQH
jgi:hypothetical protein